MATEVIIRIVNQTQRFAPSADAAEPDNAPKASANDKTDTDSMNLSGQSAISMASQMVSMVVADSEYYFGKYVDATENYHASMAIQNAKTFLSTFGSPVTSTIGGAVRGYLSGGLPGAVVEGVSSAMQSIQKMINSFSNALKENYDARVELIQNAYDNYFYGRRAGYVTGGYGTEN